ncbi:RagB/SusD family nutrient uptake outer membrane protein [Chitinophaga horti]|uniref:RagB/SusD family nutrient uptake outer membrane protein n=1 Tax=Chitinophaga horti TaxID=2920382 RepID=A0ABY6J100_9BACT|nr:RagB/SusD family nutrient uptake outer membrane protein [Chitinophaga horti]UYQ93336.1 RagB/SusD family nutrient uptake outer membrane protein [Chitinophaga horti]
MKKLMILLTAVTGLAACTDLDENVYSRINADNFYHNKGEVLAAVTRPYTHANAWAAPTGQNGYWRLSELSADQLAWPQKGRHGYDGGDWIRLHYHTWVPLEGTIENAWRLMFSGMGFCNNTLKDLAAVDFAQIGMTEQEKGELLAETRVLRAWHYLKLMDLFGKLPIATVPGEGFNPETKERPEVFAWIEKEILDNMDSLPVLTTALAGRVTKAAALSMLAELYINAEVWTGTPRYADCIAVCNRIIAGEGGALTGSAPVLENDIYKAFNNTNHLSTENLFQIAYDLRQGDFNFGWNGDFWHYRQREIYNVDRDGNNGIVVIPSAYDAFEDNDLRKTGWMLIGPQVKKTNGQPVLGTEEYSGKPLVFVKEIRRNSEGETGEGGMTRGEENSGARFAKYVPGELTDEVNYWGNDFVLYRLTEIYLWKAEAIMRGNGKVANAEAVTLVNDVRKRAFTAQDWVNEAYTAATLTLDELLAERGREFIFEGKRRQDLIRFGKFTTATWWDHPASGQAKWNVFPIPQNQRALNPNLGQNTGYE